MLDDEDDGAKQARQNRFLHFFTKREDVFCETVLCPFVRVCVCVTWRAICSETVTLCSIFTYYNIRKKHYSAPHTASKQTFIEVANAKEKKYFLCATKIGLNSNKSTDTKKNHNH